MLTLSMFTLFLPLDHRDNQGGTTALPTDSGPLERTSRWSLAGKGAQWFQPWTLKPMATTSMSHDILR